MPLITLPFALVDVFAQQPLAGNSLSVFLLDRPLPTPLLQQITIELRQFETIFLWRTDADQVFDARIFTMEEELEFAGHPIIGAAAWLHSHCFGASPAVELQLRLAGRRVAVRSERSGDHYLAEMDQGLAHLQPPLTAAQSAPYLRALNLEPADLPPGLPLQVISTGLPYLIVPLSGGLEKTRITTPDFEALLAQVGAKFVYVLDVTRPEGRTWDNDGRVEDIATGSAAGPAGVYLVLHGLAAADSMLRLQQGRFVHRESELQVQVKGDVDSGYSVTVGGPVCLVGEGWLRLVVGD